MQKLSREQFYNFSLVLLYRLQKKNELCKTPPNLSFFEYEKRTLALLIDDRQMISPTKLDEVLHRLTGTIPHHNHGHDHKSSNHDRHRRSIKSGNQERQQKHDFRFSAFKTENHDHDDHEEEIVLPALYKEEVMFSIFFSHRHINFTISRFVSVCFFSFFSTIDMWTKVFISNMKFTLREHLTKTKRISNYV